MFYSVFSNFGKIVSMHNMTDVVFSGNNVALEYLHQMHMVLETVNGDIIICNKTIVRGCIRNGKPYPNEWAWVIPECTVDTIIYHLNGIYGYGDTPHPIHTVYFIRLVGKHDSAYTIGSTSVLSDRLDEYKSRGYDVTKMMGINTFYPIAKQIERDAIRYLRRHAKQYIPLGKPNGVVKDCFTLKYKSFESIANELSLHVGAKNGVKDIEYVENVDISVIKQELTI